MAKEEGLTKLIVFLIALFVVGLLLVVNAPKDNSAGSQITIGIGNMFIWVVVIFLLIFAVIGLIILVKKLGFFDDFFNEVGI